MRLLFALALLCAFPAPAFADTEQHPPKPITHVEVDEEGRAIRFIVDGIEVARFTPDGLKTRGDIEYGGVIRDVGSETYDERIVGDSHEE